MSKEQVGRNSSQLTMRIPLSVHEKVKEMAKRNRRSLNSEILMLIENAIDLKESNQNAAH